MTQSAAGPSKANRYAAWFWQSFGLLHLERLAQSEEPASLATFDMMLTSCLPGAWRTYFDVRDLPWEGEKAALRYWSEHDQGYLQTVRRCMEIADRGDRLVEYRELVMRTLAPVGPVVDKGTTAVILSSSDDPAADLQGTLQFWNALFGR